MLRTADDWSQDWSVKVEDAGRLYKDKAYYSVNEYLQEHNR